ncbi:F-box protein [Trichophyton violaceum]|uniref:F-box protein n=1 Tax=Trichophyton violaceum TaxID=34388 RepID=A0A178FJW8_TRIVO|nr:F-box protein [Trichophyton violaceum]
MSGVQQEDELESFRRQWLEEVRTRHPPPPAQSQQQPASEARPAERRKSLQPRPQASIQLPQDLADEADEDGYTKVDTSELDGEFKSLELGSEKTEEKAPQSALEHFERAIEKEDQGRLGDSLSLYRKAYRLDAKVDQAYREKHHANAKPYIPPAASVSGLTHPSTPEKVDVASFGNLPILPVDPIIENTPPPPCPIARLPSEVLIEILKHVALLDPALFFRLSLVCKRLAYHFMHEQHIWRRLCQGTEFGLASMHYSFACQINGSPIDKGYVLGSDSDSESDSQIVHSHPFTAQITATIPKPLTSWSHVFQAFPRLRFTGVYLSTVNYMRPGANSAMQSVSWNSPIHIVTYYRYLRFYPDGTVLSLLSTTEPVEVVHHLSRENIDLLAASSTGRKHTRHISDTPAPAPQATSTASPMPPTAAAALKHTLRGRWRLAPPTLSHTAPAPTNSASTSGQPSSRRLTSAEPPSASTSDPRDLFIETEGVDPKYTYSMHLSLRSAGSHKSKNTKLAWKGFWSYNRLTDDWAEFTLRNDRAFVFRRPHQNSIFTFKIALLVISVSFVYDISTDCAAHLFDMMAGNTAPNPEVPIENGATDKPSADPPAIEEPLAQEPPASEPTIIEASPKAAPTTNELASESTSTESTATEQISNELGTAKSSTPGTTTTEFTSKNSTAEDSKAKELFTLPLLRGKITLEDALIQKEDMLIRLSSVDKRFDFFLWIVQHKKGIKNSFHSNWA